MDRAAFPLQLRSRSVHIIHRNVAHPSRLRALLGRVIRDRHQARHTLPIGRKDAVFLALRIGVLHAPANHVGIEFCRRLGIGRHDVVPEELTLHRCVLR